MNHPDETSAEAARGGTASRRNVLKALGAGGAAVAAAPLLAACGGGSGSSSGSKASSGPSGGSKVTVSADVQKIKSFVPIDDAHSAKGLQLDMGAVLAFSGAGAFFGRVMSNGMKLAAKHVEALGGPKFNFIFKDHKSGDPQAGVQAAKELGFAKVPMMLASYNDDLGAMVPAQGQYKIFTMDGGGGTSLFVQGKPFFWGMRAITPNDTIPGVAKYISEQMKDVKKIVMTGWDLGELNALIVDDVTKRIGEHGLQRAGAYLPNKIGTTDYSATIQKIRSAKADMVFLYLWGNDPGYFMKQYATSGVNKPVVTFEYTKDAGDVAGSAYDGVYFAYDFFDATKPDNGWSKIFIDEYKKNYGSDPDFYAANYYEDVFAMWECVQRVLKGGGNVKDGTALDAALRAKPVFKSVYGGDANTAGEIELDLTTHSVKRRPMSITQYKNGKFDTKAYFNLDAADYRLA